MNGFDWQGSGSRVSFENSAECLTSLFHYHDETLTPLTIFYRCVFSPCCVYFSPIIQKQSREVHLIQTCHGPKFFYEAGRWTWAQKSFRWIFISAVFVIFWSLFSPFPARFHFYKVIFPVLIFNLTFSGLRPGFGIDSNLTKLNIWFSAASETLWHHSLLSPAHVFRIQLSFGQTDELHIDS